MDLTFVHNVALVEVNYDTEKLSDLLQSIFLCELVSAWKALEKPSAYRKFGDDVVFNLRSILN